MLVEPGSAQTLEVRLSSLSLLYLRHIRTRFYNLLHFLSNSANPSMFLQPEEHLFNGEKPTSDFTGSE